MSHASNIHEPYSTQRLALNSVHSCGDVAAATFYQQALDSLTLGTSGTQAMHCLQNKRSKRSYLSEGFAAGTSYTILLAMIVLL